MAKVFLSHSTKDKIFARKLKLDIEANGHSVWFDESSIKVGDYIDIKIEEGLQSTDFLILLLSENAINSNWVETEWRTKYYDEVKSGKIKLLPARLENCPIPKFIERKKYADFTGDYRTGLDELLKAISRSSNSEIQTTENSESDVDIRNIIKSVLNNDIPISKSIADSLFFSIKSKDHQLKCFCTSELEGYNINIDCNQSKLCPENIPDWRIIPGYISRREIPLLPTQTTKQFFDYISKLPGFTRINMVIPQPINVIEADFIKFNSEASSSEIFKFTLPIRKDVQRSNNPEITIFYCQTSSYLNIVERTRENLLKLLRTHLHMD